MTPEPTRGPRRRTGMNPRLLLAPLLLGLALPLGVATAPAASALSCVGPATVLEDAEAIYTGRIVDGGGSRIEVAVEEIWRGERTPARVELGVGLTSWWPDGTPTDGLPEGYAPEGTWLFAPADGEVNPCTAWPLADYVTEASAEFRPEVPRQPLEARPQASPVVPARDTVRHGGTDHTLYFVVFGGGAAALAGAFSWWGLRRSRG